MHSLLSQLLAKFKVKYESLTGEEKLVYDQWNQSLQVPDVSIDDLKQFLSTQLALLHREQNSYENTKDKDLYLKAQIRNLEMILAFITGPDARRKWAAEQIEQLTK